MIAFAAIAVHGRSTGQSGARAAALSTGALWALWPVLLGGVLAIGLWRSRLPPVREGDIVVLGEADRATAVCGKTIESFDVWLRQWLIASLSLLSIAILLAITLMASR